VILLHEIPGITPEFLRFTTWVAEAGFRVHLPDLFGEVGRPVSHGYVLRSFARICLSREFSVLACGHSGVLADWLRALTAHVHESESSKRVGVVGMCLTGHFALALMTEPHVDAPVLSNPSLPLTLGAERRAAVHLSEREWSCVEQRCRAGAQVLGLRFRDDNFCPAERFATLRSRLGDAFMAIELDPRCGNPNSPTPHPHGVLTTDLIDADDEPTKRAALQVIAFLREHLNRP
jgi:dienelactone hydrolase